MSQTLQVVPLPACPPERFLRQAQGTLMRLERERMAPPVLLVAELDSEALLLGRFQRGSAALDRKAVEAAGLPVLRRNSGGRALQVGRGVVAVALVLPSMGSLLGAPLPAPRVMNRYVRGLLAGLTRLGATGGARFFGRDFVSCRSLQLAALGHDGGRQAAMVEAFIAVERGLALAPGLSGYPEHGDPRHAGPAWEPLAAHRKAPPSFQEVVDTLARSHASTYGCLAAQRRDLVEEPLGVGPAVFEEEAGFESSGVADVPIGFLEALAKESDGRITEARLRGDFMAPGALMASLESELVGCEAAFGPLGARVNEAFARPYAFTHGLAELRVFPEALLVALGRMTSA